MTGDHTVASDELGGSYRSSDSPGDDDEVVAVPLASRQLHAKANDHNDDLWLDAT